MENQFEIEQILCLNCGHRWILIYNGKITTEQRLDWVEKSLNHHEQIKREKGEK